MAEKLKLKFLGAAQTVTGSRTLVEYGSNKFLIDCGLFQGPRELRAKNWEEFKYTKDLSMIILTHAHIDHSGFLPKLAQLGFRGPIYSSFGTRDLCNILLMDSAHLQEEDAKFANRTKYSNHDPALPLYTQDDAHVALKLFQPLPFHQWQEIFPGISFRFLRAGHILGSSLVQIAYKNNHGQKLITFSGDLGNSRSFIIDEPERLIETDYLVLESTYGDRMQPRDNPLEALGKVISKVISRGGTLVIPAFSVGRTQELLYMIAQLEEQKKIPKTPVFLDSPMADKATAVYLEHETELKKELRNGKLSPNLSLSSFHAVASHDDSLLLCANPEPKIVISAAGMLTGGRILHHLKAKLPDAKNGVLFVGYQAQGTKGRLLKNGMSPIRIHHQNIAVAAEIFSMDQLSAHADAADLVKWVQAITEKPELVFLNHGEPNALDSLKFLLKTELNIRAHIVKPDEEIVLA